MLILSEEKIISDVCEETSGLNMGFTFVMHTLNYSRHVWNRAILVCKIETTICNCGQLYRLRESTLRVFNN